MKIKEKIKSWITKMRVKLVYLLMTKEAYLRIVDIEQAHLLNSGRAQGALAAYRELCNYIAQSQDLDRVKEYAKNRYNQYLHHNKMKTGAVDGTLKMCTNSPMRRVDTELTIEEESALRKVASSMVHL